MSKYAVQVNRCLLRIKQGDESRYRELFDLTFNHLKGIAKMYLCDKSYCDDVVMETYERVMKYINTFDERQDGYNWLCQITKRVAFVTNSKNHIFDNAKEIEETDICDDFFERANQRLVLDNVIDELDAEDKTIVISYYYLDMTYEEIGKRIGKTKSAIHKRLKIIFRKLKKKLQEGNFDQ